jgi:hypothetical protein
VARIGRGEVRTGFWWSDPRARDHLEGLGVRERMILKWILRSSMGGGRGLDGSGSREGQVAGCCESGNEP